MTVCPNCFHLLEEAGERCPLCSALLEPELHSDPPVEIEWAIARTFSTEISATIAAGRLRAYGIPAFVLSQVDSTRGFTVGALAVAKVFVPIERKEEAENILASPEDLPEGFDG